MRYRIQERRDEMQQQLTEREQFGASSNGFLPVQVLVFLLTCAFIGVWLITSGLNVVASPFIIVFGAGVIAGVAVKLYQPDSIRLSIMSICSLWVSTITLFTGAAWALRTGVGHWFVAFAVSGMVFLIPFGLIGNSMQSFGDGSSRTVVKQYSMSAVVLIVLSIALLSQEFVFQLITEFFTVAITPVSGSGVLSDSSVYVRGVMGVFVYAVALYLVKRIVDGIPLEVFVSVSDYGVVNQFRERADTGFKYGLVGLGLLLLVVVTVFILESQLDAWWVSVLRAILGVITAPVLLGTVFTVSILSVAGMLATSVLHRFTALSPAGLVKVLTPPVILLSTSFIFTAVFKTELIAGAGSVLGESSTTLIDFFTLELSLSMVVVLVTAMIVGGGILLLPSVIVRMRIVDPSVSGLTTSVVFLGTLSMFLVLNHANPLIIITTVILCVVIWDVGEYSIIVVGEATPEQSRTLPDGFSYVVGVHSGVTLVLAATAVVLAAMFIQIFAVFSVPAPLAILVIILSAMSLGIIFTLITA